MHSPFSLHPVHTFGRPILFKNSSIWQWKFDENHKTMKILKCDWRKKNYMKTIPRNSILFYLWFKNSEQNEKVHHIYRCLWIEISYIQNWRSNSSFISWPEIKSPVTKSSVKKWSKDAFHEIDTLHKIHMVRSSRKQI